MILWKKRKEFIDHPSYLLKFQIILYTVFNLDFSVYGCPYVVVKITRFSDIAKSS